MRTSVILTLFLVLTTVFSLYTVAYARGLPTTQQSNQLDSTYSLNGRYDYVAALTPNLLYNTSVLSMGNGSLFTSITKSINVTFTMTLRSSVPADATIDSNYVATLFGGDWNTTLDQAANETQMTNANSVVIARTFQFNITMIQQLIKGLETQLKYVAAQYAIEVKPVIGGSLTASGQTVNLRFLAPLNLTMSNGVISANGTDYSQNGTITSLVTLTNSNNVRLRTISYSAFFGSLICAVTSGVYSVAAGRRKKLSPDKYLEESTRPYREIIAASTSPPGDKQIVMEKWEDLVKIADTLGKPMLEFVETKPGGEARHLFYVPEGDACYVYAFEAKLKEEPEGKPESESSPAVVAGGQQPLGDDLGDVSNDGSSSG